MVDGRMGESSTVLRVYEEERRSAAGFDRVIAWVYARLGNAS